MSLTANENKKATLDLRTSFLNWTEKQSLWQRDLLRRLAQGEVIGTVDYRAYANEAERVELAKPAPWSRAIEVSDPGIFFPINVTHLQATASDDPPVYINKITHIEGANDLAPGATLEFANSGLTIIAGRNGSGKSGYTRILKQTAASRGPEKVIPNVYRPTAVPKAVIFYQTGSSPAHKLTWQSDAQLEDNPLKRVRIFDSKSADMQLSSSNEIAYIPFELQVLADYTSALKAIGDIINDDIRQLTLCERTLPVLETGMGFEIHEQLGKSSCLIALNKYAAISEIELSELGKISGKIQALNVSDPAKMAIQARSRSGQLSTLARNLGAISAGLDTTRIEESIDITQRVSKAERSIEEVSKQIQEGVVVPKTGSEKWRKMWRAAKEFIEEASSNQYFDLENGSVCALCQQPLNDLAHERFVRFADFMKGEAQTELEEALKVHKSNVSALKALPIESSVNQNLIDLVTTYDKRAGEALQPIITRAAALRDCLFTAKQMDDLPKDAAELKGELQEIVRSLDKAAADENSAAERFGSSDSNALEINKLQIREQELKLKQQLASAKSDIEALHDLAIKVIQIQTAAKSCETTAASKVNTKLSKEYVDKVCAAFSSEAKTLGLDRIPVELVFDRSTRGVSYIKVSLVGAPGISVPTVLSEGERRVAAIAGFFADLTESGDHSSLIFDDPVCSLDQSFREAVARRLLVEAGNRQVLVFTHDYTFVQYLYEQRSLLEKSAANSRSVGTVASIEYIHIARTKNGVGEPTSAEQWRQVTVLERIKRINARIQDASVLYRSHDLAYEKEAHDISGAIRETWECLVEEILFNNVLNRHERAIQTQRLKKIVDICDTDVSAIDDGMTVTSRWLTGHTAPVDDGTQIISPDQLKDEIKKLDNLRKCIIERREKKR